MLSANWPSLSPFRGAQKETQTARRQSAASEQPAQRKDRDTKDRGRTEGYEHDWSHSNRDVCQCWLTQERDICNRDNSFIVFSAFEWSFTRKVIVNWTWAHLDVLLSDWTLSLSAKLREASDMLDTEYPRGRDPEHTNTHISICIHIICMHFLLEASFKSSLDITAAN